MYGATCRHFPVTRIGCGFLLAGLFFAMPTRGQNEWYQVPDSVPLPGPTSHHAMVYDSARGVIVLFGGTIGASAYAQSETWEWSCATRAWTQRNPPTSPPPRYTHAMAYDSARHVVVLFGGREDWSMPERNETWEYDGNNWSQRFPQTVPGARIAHAMAYDKARAQTVMFGGHLSGARLNDTWLWDGNNWTEASVPVP